MPTCTNCQHEWSWKEAVKSSFRLTPTLKCPTCGERQYLTKKSRKRMVFFNWVVLIPLVLNAFIELGFFFFLCLTFFFLLLSISLLPFNMELAKEEEPLW